MMPSWLVTPDRTGTLLNSPSMMASLGFFGMKGLEDQLLGIVIGQEQRALQDQLQEVLAECNANTKTLQLLDAELLDRLEPKRLVV